MKLQLGVRSEAIFDASLKNRFVLRRIWNESLPRLAFLMLNPSTASDLIDDPTVRKTQTYARLWGYGSVTVVNIFPWRATNPCEWPEKK